MTWRNNWNKNKAMYKSPPSTLTWEAFINGLPGALPDAINLFVTGGLTRNGFTNKDIDFIIYIDEPSQYRNALREMTKELFGYGCHIGNSIWDYTPKPIAIQLYIDGTLKDKIELKTQVKKQDKEIPSRQTCDFDRDIEARLKALEKGKD